jgi:hypothetical protein
MPFGGVWDDMVWQNEEKMKNERRERNRNLSFMGVQVRVISKIT